MQKQVQTGSHIPVLLEEVLSFLPSSKEASLYLDATFGGGGHFFSVLERGPKWRGVAIDRDPLARERMEREAKNKNCLDRVEFLAQPFSQPVNKDFSFILADLGVSSFQLDDMNRGMSLKSTAPVDMRMNPQEGPNFVEWLATKSVRDLERIFQDYGEEPKARKIAAALKEWDKSFFQDASQFATRVAKTLAYPSNSRVHPATRVFQALRIAINGELEEVERFLEWAPQRLVAGGRLAVISFHSLEDRIVKFRFKDLAASGGFDILTKKALQATSREVALNSRARSAKLRVLERV